MIISHDEFSHSDWVVLNTVACRGQKWLNTLNTAACRGQKWLNTLTTVACRGQKWINTLNTVACRGQKWLNTAACRGQKWLNTLNTAACRGQKCVDLMLVWCFPALHDCLHGCIYVKTVLRTSTNNLQLVRGNQSFYWLSN